MPQLPFHSNRLRVLRRRLGLSQRELAFLLGHSESQVCRLERGSRTPLLAEALVIELVFGVPVKAIFAEFHEAVTTTLLGRARDLRSRLRKVSQGSDELSLKTSRLDSLLRHLSARSATEESVAEQCSANTNRTQP